MNELIVNVEDWAKDKGLDKADSCKQYLKVSEEVGEIAATLIVITIILMSKWIGLIK